MTDDNKPTYLRPAALLAAKLGDAEAVDEAAAAFDADMAAIANDTQEKRKGYAVEIETKRQIDLDAAMADVVEIVQRHRARLGRKTCTPHDGKLIRQMWGLLRSMQEGQQAGESPWSDKP